MFAALGNGDRDLVFFYGYDVENDGIFSVKELKFFQIKFVHGTPPQSMSLYQIEYSTSISLFS